MPSPVLHGAVGAALFAVGRRSAGRKPMRVAGLVVAAALLPDIDFLPGLVFGDPNRFHNGPTHSITFAVVAAAGMVWLGVRLKVLDGGRRLAFFLLLLLAGVSHTLLDGLCADERPPYGVPIFWPVSEYRFQVADPWFDGIEHGRTGAGAGEFFRSIICLSNLKAVAKELGIGLAVLALGYGIGRTRAAQSLFQPTVCQKSELPGERRW